MKRTPNSLFALIVSVSLSALILALFVTGALADNPCSKCSCSGDGSCVGCHMCYAESDCTKPQLGLTVDVPFNSFYNYCYPLGSGECTTLPCLNCYTVFQGATWYTDNCKTAGGTLGSDRYVRTLGACSEP